MPTMQYTFEGAMVEPTRDDTACNGCGDNTNSPIEIEGKSYCSDCVANCESCDNPICTHDATSSDCGNYYCQDCYDKLFHKCDRCGCEVCVADIVSASDNTPYCRDCYDELFFHCEACGLEERSNSAYNSSSGDSYCEDCYNDQYCTCCACETEISRDEAFNNNNGCYCESCYNDGPNAEWDFGRFYPTNPTYVRIRSTVKFGIELETSECPDHNSIEGCTVFGCKPDGSISGQEFVSPPLWGDEGLDKVSEFCALANNNGFKVDNSCGYHLHLNASDLTVAQLKAVAYAYLKTYDVWSSFVRPTRRTNHYCRQITDWNRHDLNRINDQIGWNQFVSEQDRYVWFNVSSYRVHKTFEIRLHTSTLNKNKVCNWIMAHARFVDYVKNMSFAQIDRKFAGDIKAKFRALSGIWDDTELSDYYAGRAYKFGTNVGIHEIAIV